MAIDSDTELRIPGNKLKRLFKWLWLHFLFTRKYCYGFAGGNYGHKDLFRHYGMTEERIFLMPMMVDNAKYSRNDVSRPHEPFRFGYLGRLVSIKQVDKVIEALPKLYNGRLTDLPFVYPICGKEIEISYRKHILFEADGILENIPKGDIEVDDDN